MCSHKSITWKDINNAVTDRMIDNSLIHKFSLSRNFCKSTKIINNKIKENCGVKDYKQYINLKTNVLRNLIKDTDTDDPGRLTDVDYDIIYSSPSEQTKYVTEHTEYIFTSEEDWKSYELENNTTTKKKKKYESNNTRIQNKNTKIVKKKKPLQAECNTISSEKHINIDWQDVIKGNRNTLHLSDNQVHTNTLEKEETVLKDNYDYLNIQSNYQSNNQSLSLFDSENSKTSSTIRSEDENIDQEHGEFNTADKSNPEDIACNIEIKPVNENKNYEDRVINQSDALGLQSPQVSPSKSISLENNNLGNELNTFIKLKDDNSNKLTKINNKSLINPKNHTTFVNIKSNLLENVRQNLMVPLIVQEKIIFTGNNKDIKSIEDKSVEDRLSDDQSLLSTANSSQHNILLWKTQTNASKTQNLSPGTLSLNQQKDSGFDENSQDKVEQPNIKNSTNLDIAANIAVSPQQFKNIAEINETIALEVSKNIKEDIKDIHLKPCNDNLGEQGNEEKKEPFGKEVEDSSRLNQDNKDVEICSINKEDKTHLVEQESCNIQDSREEKSSEEEVKNFLQLNQVDKNAKILINQEKKTHFVKPEDSCNIQNRQLVSLKEDRMEDAHSESCNNILEKQDDKIVKEKKEKKNFLHLDQIDKDTEIYSINHEDKIHMESENIYNIQKQQLLPKVTCTEIVNKKYKLINKKDNINSNIKKSDNICINTSIVNKDTPVKNNRNVINHNIDNWQEEVANTVEIGNVSMTLETDNEENDLNDLSPQSKKRLQQQARLNLVISDSSESDEEYITTETSRKHIVSSDTNHCSEDSRFKNDKISCASKKTNTDISCNKDMYIHNKETTPVPIKEIVKPNSTKMREKIKKKADETISAKCTDENINSLNSTSDKELLKKTQSCENVYNSDDNQNEYINVDENFRKSPKSNASYDSEEHVNQFSRDKQSLLDKENVYHRNNQYERNQCEDSTRDYSSEHETGCSEQMQISTNCSSVHIDTSWYRPHNLQELVEDQNLLVETISPSFTLTDLSEDDEAFILNIPSKVLQYNLQDELMILKDKTIKFGENKYKIVCRKMGTTTCIFATGKQRKPYKIVNIKEVSNITVRERLSHHSRRSDVISSKSKSTKINNQQIEKTSSKMPEVLNHNKRKRRSSDIETKSATKKERLSVIHS